MDGLDIFNVYVMGSIEMLTVFHFFTRFLKKKVKFIYYILFAIFGIAVIRIFTDDSIMELLVYVLLLMAGGFFICKTYNIFVGLYAVVMIEIMHLCYGISNSVSCILSPFLFLENPKAVSFFFMIISSIIALVTSVLCYQVMEDIEPFNVIYKTAEDGMGDTIFQVSGVSKGRLTENIEKRIIITRGGISHTNACVGGVDNGSNKRLCCPSG